MKALLPFKKITTPLVVLSLVAGSSLATTQSYAGEKHRQDRWGNQVHFYQNSPRSANRNHYQQSRKRSRTGEYLAAGIIGLAFGAIIANSANRRSLANQNYNYPSTNYSYDALRKSYATELNPYTLPKAGSVYQNDDVITFEESASLEPWTPGWREYCSQRYRTFDPRSGTFKGYDGLHHFCVAK